MSKVKNYYWDLAEKESDKIIDQYVKNIISKDDAIKQLSNVENLDLVGIDEYNVDEVLDMAKEEAA
jgi:predicted ATPase